MSCTKRNLMTALVSILLKSRASLTCFRVCFLPGRAKDLSAPRYYGGLNNPRNLIVILFSAAISKCAFFSQSEISFRRFTLKIPLRRPCHKMFPMDSLILRPTQIPRKLTMKSNQQGFYPHRRPLRNGTYKHAHCVLERTAKAAFVK